MCAARPGLYLNEGACYSEHDSHDQGSCTQHRPEAYTVYGEQYSPWAMGCSLVLHPCCIRRATLARALHCAVD